MEIADAIEATAESDDPALSALSATSSRKRVLATQRMILRFLQNVPEDVTVLELRRAIEDQE